MLTIEYDKRFVKNFRTRIRPYKKLLLLYEKHLQLFMENPKQSILKNHRLVGRQKDKRSFSITGDIRVIYIEESATQVVFLDVGTHNQVY